MKKIILLAFCFLTLGQAKAGPSVGVLKTANYSHILAKLFYVEEKGGRISNPRMRVIRGKKMAYNKLLKLENNDLDLSIQKISPPILQDLDEDWDPEIIIELSTEKNNCCNYTLIYRYDPSLKTYTYIAHNWGGIVKGRKLEDLDKDGTPEFISRNTSFLNEYGDKEGSRLPLQIWHYEKGKMIDVTREFPEIVQADAKKFWEEFAKARKAKKYDVFIIKDTLRAYLASKYNLGQAKDGWRLVKEVYKGKDKAEFIKYLENFFEEVGFKE